MLLFTINSIPVPQKQTRFCMRGKFPHAYDPSKKDMEMIQWQIKPFAPKQPFTTPIEVFYSFFLPIPKSTSKIRTRQMMNGAIKHIKKPDIDNLSYIVTNAMKNIVYQDDSQIIRFHAEKLYSDDPRTVIKVIELPTIEGFYEVESNKI